MQGLTHSLGRLRTWIWMKGEDINIHADPRQEGIIHHQPKHCYFLKIDFLPVKSKHVSDRKFRML